MQPSLLPHDLSWSTWKSREVVISSFSLNHCMIGAGVPVTIVSNVTLSPSSASIDVIGVINLGGSPPIFSVGTSVSGTCCVDVGTT